MRHTKKILAATLSTIVLGSGLYTYKVIDDLHMKIDGLHIQLDEKERLIVEANKDIDQLVLSQNDLKDKLSYKEEEINVLNQTIEGKDKSIKSLQQQLEKAKKESESPRREVSRGSSDNGRVLNIEATAYGADCAGCSGVTASGYDVSNTIYYQGMRVVAMDTSLVPMHSIILVQTKTETFKAIVLDRGGAIKGHRLDLLVESEAASGSFGRQQVKVRVIREGKGG